MAGFKLHVLVLFLLSAGFALGDDPAAVTKAKEDESKILYQKMLDASKTAEDVDDRDSSVVWAKTMSQLVNGTDDATSDVVIDYLAAAKESDYKPSDLFANDYVAYYLEKVSGEGKIDRMTFIVDKFHPRWVGWYPADIAMARTPDGIQVLLDLIPKMKDLSAKQYYTKRLRDDFLQISREHVSDEEFLDEVRHWYESNKEQLIVNPQFLIAHGPGAGQVGFNAGLFIRKHSDGAESTEGGTGSMAQYLMILGSVIPLFLLMGVGAVVRRFDVLNEQADRTLVNLMVHLLYPCLILDHVIASTSLRQAGNLLWSPLLGFLCTAGGIVLAYGLARLCGIPVGARTRTFAFVAGIFNYGYLPVPLVAVLYGDATLGVLFAFNLGVEVAFWVVGFAMLEQASVIKEWPRIFTSPVRAILLGVAINLVTAQFGVLLDAKTLEAASWGWPVKLIVDTIHLAGMCSIPLAMLLIGATMADFWGEFRATRGVKVMAIGLLVRNVLVPALMVATAVYLPVSLELKETLVVQAAMPAAVFTLLLARHHGGDVPVALQIIFVTSAAAIVTLPLWIHFGMQLIGVR